MPLDKNKTVAEIGRRTRLRNHDVQRMVEALIVVWTEELASGGRIEIQNFLVLEVEPMDRVQSAGAVLVGDKLCRASFSVPRLAVRPGKNLRARLRR